MKKNLQAILSVALMLAMSISLVACGSKESETTQTTSEIIVYDDTQTDTEITEAVDDTETTIGETVYPLEVIDSNGNSVTLEQEPEKIISVAPNITELIYKLGAEDKLIGRSEYCDYPTEALDIQSIGTIMEPNIEAIVALEPDVVLASSLFDEEVGNKLAEAGINVVVLSEQNDVNGVYNMIETVGLILNKKDEAASCIEEMKTIIDEVTSKVEGLETPTVYYVVGYGEYGDYTAGGDTYISGIITLAGGDNIAKDVSGWSITLEEIIAADPDIIIISEYCKTDFMSMEQYADLTAVKEDKVYTVDVNTIERQGYRNAEGIAELAKIFHPEAFN